MANRQVAWQAGCRAREVEPNSHAASKSPGNAGKKERWSSGRPCAIARQARRNTTTAQARCAHFKTKTASETQRKGHPARTRDHKRRTMETYVVAADASTYTQAVAVEWRVIYNRRMRSGPCRHDKRTTRANSARSQSNVKRSRREVRPPTLRTGSISRIDAFPSLP